LFIAYVPFEIPLHSIAEILSDVLSLSKD